MTLLAWLLYIPLQIIWLPLSLIGAILVGYRQIAISKRMGVSQTAVEVINGRWAMDVFGLRKDKAARKLAAKIPNNSTFGLWLALFPLWVARQIAGKPILYPTIPTPQKAGFANLVPSRTIEFDALIAANAADASQFVVLGAGLDTRAYGPLKQGGMVIFELDQKAVQTYKRKYVTAAKIDATNIRYVETDFANTNWINVLIKAGFDPALKTIFLWEGVTLYLSESAVRDTLAALKAHAAAGSAVIADFMRTAFENRQGQADGKIAGCHGRRLWLWSGFFRRCRATLALLPAQDLTLGRHQFLGSRHRRGPFMVIAELGL